MNARYDAYNKELLASYSDEQLRSLLRGLTGGISIARGYGKSNIGINDMSRQELLNAALPLIGRI
jgi:hypothetical protein